MNFVNVEQFPSAVELALGAARTDAALGAERRMQAVVAAAPERGVWTALSVPLHGETEKAASQELADLIRSADPDGEWFFVVAHDERGRRFGLASDAFILPSQPSWEAAARFVVFDLHSRFGGWWRGHLWRAADLATSTLFALHHWQIIPAAACARAMLEGAAAFVVEGNDLIAAWDDFKRKGPHRIDDTAKFRKRFNDLLSQAQMG